LKSNDIPKVSILLRGSLWQVKLTKSFSLVRNLCNYKQKRSLVCIKIHYTSLIDIDYIYRIRIICLDKIQKIYQYEELLGKNINLIYANFFLQFIRFSLSFFFIKIFHYLQLYLSFLLSMPFPLYLFFFSNSRVWDRYALLKAWKLRAFIFHLIL
jgi:hypothetical protein